MVETLTNGFCSELHRKTITFKGKKRRAIFKKARNSMELSLLKNEIFFYSKLLPLYNTLEKLHFEGKKFCPTFFDTKKEGTLIIEDLRKYETKANLSYSSALLVLSKLATFHAIGFFLKNIITNQKISERIRGPQKWCTLIHGDSWSRNFMFRGKKEVKLIDFGFYEYDSCFKDVVYLLFTSVRTLRIIHLIEHYKDNLFHQLKKLNIEIDSSDFYIEVGKTAKRIYPLASKILKTIRSGSDREYQLAHAETYLKILSWHSQRG